MTRRSPLSRAGLVLATTAVLAFTLFPVYWMVSTAFDPQAASGARSLLPGGFGLDNFRVVLTQGGFGTFLRNSIVVALGTVLASGLLSLFAAVAVSRFRFRLRTSVLVMILIVQMVPVEALVIPLFIQVRTLGMLNSLLGLVVVYVGFSLSFAIWNLRGFVAAVPVELEEAAYLDGASWWRMFRSILLPLVAPGLVATSVFSFITAWNEFIFALTFMQDDSLYTVAVGLRRFFGQFGTDWGLVMAASTLITLPVMVFFVIAQRRLTSGLVSGAVKG
ncbi:MAG: carbohydrate ABC transporter permease [Actinomycetota bacterium]|nr:carbohydrate ABC transporter permease [Actinomycetota bacterium]